MKLYVMIMICFLLLVPAVFATDEDWITLRADPRFNISFPDDWNFQDVSINYQGMKAFLIMNDQAPGMYALVMVFDNPIYQVPDKDLLFNLESSLMDDFPDYEPAGDALYGSDEKLPYFSLSQYDNRVTKEKMNLIVAGSKKSLVYLLMVYPSQLMEDLFSQTMNDIAMSLTIF